MSNETPCCPVCWQSFDSEEVLPIVFSCGHGICSVCNENAMEKCHICREPITSRVKNSSLIETLKNLDTMCHEIEEPYRPKNNFRCSNCQKWMFVKNMHFCQTCLIDRDFLANSYDERTSKVIHATMCSNCIVPMHSYKGHTVSAISSILNFSIQLSKIKSKVEELENVIKFSEWKFGGLENLSTEIHKQYSEFIEMSSKNKFKKKHSEMIESFENFINEAIWIYIKVEFELNRYAKNPQCECCLSSVTSKNKTKLEKFEVAWKLLNLTFSDLKGSQIKNYNVLLDIAQRCKSIEKQNKIFGKIERRIDKKKAIHVDIQSIMVKHERLLEKSLTNMVPWYFLLTTYKLLETAKDIQILLKNA